jgi:hypothetical protein
VADDFDDESASSSPTSISQADMKNIVVKAVRPYRRKGVFFILYLSA